MSEGSTWMAATFRCGHPRTPENTVRNGNCGGACRQCHAERGRRRYRNRLAAEGREMTPRRSAGVAAPGQRGCDIEGCPNLHLARGLCRGHYTARKRTGEFGQSLSGATCGVEVCARVAVARGLCKGHYERARLDGLLPRMQLVNAGRECTEIGCREPAHSRGQCHQHYNYWRALGRYGIGRDGYLALVERQNGRCAVCGTTDPGAGAERWSIDHDHGCCPGQESCGRCVRGLLCRNCNVGLGHFDDDPDRLLAAATYLLSRSNLLTGLGSPAVIDD